MQPNGAAEGAKAPSLSCDYCAHAPFKNSCGLKSHVRFKHPDQSASVGTTAPTVEELSERVDSLMLLLEKAGAQPLGVEESTFTPPNYRAPKRVMFLSPRSPGLTVIVMRSHRQLVPIGPGLTESILMPGVTVQFVAGRLFTDDARVIAFLSGDRDECLRLGIMDEQHPGHPKVYQSDRYPVIGSDVAGDVPISRKVTEPEAAARASANPG